MTDFICTTRNAATTLHAMLASIKAQTNPNWRLLIWDDGSSDTTLDIITREARHDNRIVLVGQEKIGRARALNKALAAVKSTYFLNIDADDLAHPDRLEISLIAIKAHPEFTLLGTDSVHIFGDAEAVWPSNVAADQSHLHIKPIKWALLLRNVINHSSIIAHTEKVRNAGGYDEARNVQIDYECWLRLQSSGLKLGIIKLRLSGKRLHGNQSFEARLGQSYVKSSLALQWFYVSRNNMIFLLIIPFVARACWLNLPTTFRNSLKRIFKIR